MSISILVRLAVCLPAMYFYSMEKKNLVFIATSLDGFIADRDGGLDWLQSVPNPDNLDLGYEKFIKRVDAIVMGRSTYDVVRSFGIDWPYKIPVFVLSSTLDSPAEDLKDKVEVLNGSPLEVLKEIHGKGYTRLYIDGGITIQNFLKADLIDEMIITTIPVFLGGGFPLFGELSEEMGFELVGSEVYLDALVQSSYQRLR